MCYRKARVHQTGKSNADVRTISASPLSIRIPIQERSFVQTSTSFVKNIGENPKDLSIQKYKTWNKKLKKLTIDKEPIKLDPNRRMKEDPPDFANVKTKVELLRSQQDFQIPTNNIIQQELVEFVKNQSVGLKSKFIKADKNKSGILTFQDFKKVLEDINAPYGILRNLQTLYNELGGGSEGINYKEVVNKIYPRDVKLPQIDVVEGQENRVTLIDKRTAPLNQLENIYNNARKVRQFLKNTYKTQEALVAELKSSSSSEHVSLSRLESFVINKLNEMKTQKVSRREMDSFLASYDYNKDQATSISEVVKYVFMDDILAANHLHHKKRAIPPLREAGKIESQDINRIKKLLLDIEHKMFTQGPNQSLSVFKCFDKDADGYLTVEDLEQGLNLAQIPHSNDDTLKLMKFLDDNGNGFVTFNEFSKVIQPNILTINREKLGESLEKHMNISQPSTEYHIYQQSRLPALNSETQEFILKQSTRYSSSPPYKDTFVNFAPRVDCAMYMDDTTRLSAKKFEPISVSHEDKNKLRKSAEAKMIYLQKSREINENRIQEMDAKQRMLDMQKIIKSANVKSQYEAKCKAGLMN
ncbi:hypothetical protein SteCoe_35818 [Stentor coeruleus]|uniref:EF-hand domain-containing protein n=1 Tax=Stentor coeruleus TaxID=5963 RepID=A0A1R2ARJ4_9CILI|nr:hypothetical protein SteCoe_35818 [Stentor coeruleus]